MPADTVWRLPLQRGLSGDRAGKKNATKNSGIFETYSEQATRFRDHHKPLRISDGLIVAGNRIHYYRSSCLDESPQPLRKIDAWRT